VQNAAKLPLPPINFTPVQPRFPEHEAYNTLPQRLTNDAFALTPDAVFELFFSDDVLQRITTNTNIYAAQKGATKTMRHKGDGRSWTPMTVDYLKMWLSITILMGVVCEPAVKDYWRPNDGTNSVHPFTDFMDLRDFEQIKRYLPIAYPEPPAINSESEVSSQSDSSVPDDVSGLWYHKVAWLFNEMTLRSRRYRTVGSRVSVDEAMATFTGRTMHKYHSVCDTYAPARFGELPLLSVPCKTDYLTRSARFPQEVGLDGLVNLRYLLNSGRSPVTQPKILKPTVQLNNTGPLPRWSKTAINPYIQLSNTGLDPGGTPIYLTDHRQAGHGGNSISAAPDLCLSHGGHICSTLPGLWHGGNSSSSSPDLCHGGNISLTSPGLCHGGTSALLRLAYTTAVTSAELRRAYATAVTSTSPCPTNAWASA
jgi:hypothetical protein